MIKVAKRNGSYLINMSDSGYYNRKDWVVETVDGKEYKFSDKEVTIGSEPKAFYLIHTQNTHVGYEKDGELLTSEEFKEKDDALTVNALWDDEDSIFVFNNLDEEYDYRKWRKGWNAKHEMQTTRVSQEFSLFFTDDKSDMQYLSSVLNLDADSFGLYRVNIPVEAVEDRVKKRFSTGGFTVDSTWKPEARANGIYWKFYLNHKVYNREPLSWTFQLHAVGPYEDCIKWRDDRLEEIDSRVDAILSQYEDVDSLTKAAIAKKIDSLEKSVRGFAPTYSAAQKKKSEYNHAIARLKEIREMLK